MRTSTAKDIVIALFLATILSMALLALLIFYPIAVALVSRTSSGPETGGIVAVAGGISSSYLKILLIAPMLFLASLVLLHRRR